MPRSKHLGISQRLADEEQREHLLAQLNKGLAEEGVEGQGGFIIRTAALAASKKEFKDTREKLEIFKQRLNLLKFHLHP